MSAVGVEELIDDRDVRALKERMSILAGHGRAAGAPGLFYVVGEHGSSYLVDVRERSCECPDGRHRDPDGGCKHVRRVLFATGAREIPDGVEPTGELTIHGGTHD